MLGGGGVLRGSRSTWKGPDQMMCRYWAMPHSLEASLLCRFTMAPTPILPLLAAVMRRLLRYSISTKLICTRPLPQTHDLPPHRLCCPLAVAVAKGTLRPGQGGAGGRRGMSCLTHAGSVFAFLASAACLASRHCCSLVVQLHRDLQGGGGAGVVGAGRGWSRAGVEQGGGRAGGSTCATSQLSHAGSVSLRR